MARRRAGTLFRRSSTKSPYWWGAYYPTDGGKRKVVRLATDKQVSRRILDDLIVEDGRIAAGLSDPTVKHLASPLLDLVEKYLKACAFLKQHTRHCAVKRMHLRTLFESAKAHTVADLKPARMETALQEVGSRLSARTHNTYRASLIAFANYLVRQEIIASHRLGTLPKQCEKRGAVKKRRALDLGEIGNLLEIARLRPVAEYGRAIQQRPEHQRKGRKTWTRGELTIHNIHECAKRAREILSKRPQVLAKLEYRGWEREQLYRVLLLTGLRRSEAAGLRWADVDLKNKIIRIDADRGKAPRDDEVPMHEDVAAIFEQLAQRPHASGDRIFSCVPGIRVVDKDYRCAGIERRNPISKRSADLHSLRRTTGTLLANAGVPLHVTQRLLRHEDPATTTQHYLCFARTDGQKGVAALPVLPNVAD